MENQSKEIRQNRTVLLDAMFLDFFKEKMRNIGNGQARKGARRMPWHWEPTKDVVSCDKPWGGANIL